jgi:hypothetical protein
VTRGARYRLLAIVYTSQFVPLAFLLYGLSAVLREREVPLERIAFVQLLALVWVVKVAWAPLVDRYGSRRLGHYRGWLLVVQTLLTVAVLALIPVDVVSDLPLLVGIGAAIALLSATHDIAADAAAVCLLAPSERGVGNAIQRAGGYLGLMVGGGGVLIIYHRLGWGSPWSSCPCTTSAWRRPTPWSPPCWSTPIRSRSKQPSTRSEPRPHRNLVSCTHGLPRPAPTNTSPQQALTTHNQPPRHLSPRTDEGPPHALPSTQNHPRNISCSHSSSGAIPTTSTSSPTRSGEMLRSAMHLATNGTVSRSSSE